MTNVPRLASKVKQLEQFSYVEQFKIYEGEKNVFIMAHFHDILPSSGQTLALAEPEARLYNHRPTRPNPTQEQMFVLAISQPFLNGMS